MATPVCLRPSLAVCALLTIAVRGVGETPAQNAASPLTTLVATPILDYLPVWNGATPLPDSAFAPNAKAATDTATGTLLYVRVSREYLSKRFEKDVDRTKPLIDSILGTSIRGESHTAGNTHLVLVPSDDSFQADIEFVGTVRSKSRGDNGPAILRLESNSTFRATKRLTLDHVGLSTAPAKAKAKTHVQARGVQSRHAGLMGEVIERVAQRRFRQSNSQINAIAADHAGKTVAADLDRGVDKALVKLGETFAAAAGLDDDVSKTVDLKTLTAHRAGQTLHICLRTTADYAELAMTTEPATWKELAGSLPRVDGTPHVALRVHRSMMLHVATDRDSTPPIAQLLLATLQSRLVAGMAATTTPAAFGSPAPNVSFGLEWLSIDVEHTSETELAVHNAQLTTPASAEAPQ